MTSRIGPLLAEQPHLAKSAREYLTGRGKQAFGILGLPIPGELLLTLAGSLVRRGDMRASSTVAAAIGGSLAGVTLGYPQTRRFESSWNAVLETGGFLVGDEVQIALSLQAVAESNRE